MDRRIKDWIIKTEPVMSLIVWSLVIFYFSSVPGLRSGLENVVDLILRKLAHMGEFAVFTILLFRILKTVSKNTKDVILGAVIGGILYAISDEIHQLSVANRDGKILDVGIDTLGIFITGFLLMKLKAKKK